MARFYDLWDRSKVRGLVPCCGQDGYQAQVPQHPIDSYRYISHNPKLVNMSSPNVICTTRMAGNMNQSKARDITQSNKQTLQNINSNLPLPSTDNRHFIPATTRND